MSDYLGLFVTFEGAEGSGKSTQIELLADYLRGMGLPIVTIREPGGTSIGEEIRDTLHNANYLGIMTDATELLLYQASRSQIVNEIIVPELNEGKIVLSDRYSDSTVAYQGGGRGIDLKTIDVISRFATGGLIPDLTILLDVEIEDGLKRKKDAGHLNRMDMQEIEFYNRVRKAYLYLTNNDSTGRWEVVDGSRSVNEIHVDISSIIEGRLVNRGLLERRQGGSERLG